MLKFNKLMNNCYFLELGDKVILISYESVVGVIKGDILYIYSFYIGYSKTTSKHLNLFRRELIYRSEIIVDSEEEFYKLVNNY